MSLEIDNRYKIVKKIGEGAFGKVYKGIHLETKEYVAIKIEKKRYEINLNTPRIDEFK